MNQMYIAPPPGLPSSSKGNVFGGKVENGVEGFAKNQRWSQGMLSTALSGAQYS